MIAPMSEQQRGPTRWRITGARADSGQEVTLYVEATSRESAARAATKAGVMSSIVEPDPKAALASGDEAGVDGRITGMHSGAPSRFGSRGLVAALIAGLLIAAGLVLWALGYLKPPGR